MGHIAPGFSFVQREQIAPCPAVQREQIAPRPAIPTVPPSPTPSPNPNLRHSSRITRAPQWLTEAAVQELFVMVASRTDPDTLSFDEAMQQNPVAWMEATGKEVTQLEAHGTWHEEPIANTVGKILPGTWVLRIKRSPDGTISKLKARYCIRGDLQDVQNETFVPVIAFSTVCIFLILLMMFKWYTCSIDFVNAFVQASLKEPV